MKIGVCYYPEHWPESEWPKQAAHIRALGIEIVRIGEFAWSRLEKSRGDYDFDWLERAINVLADEGLKVVLGTPTATPPKWLVDAHPNMLAVDEAGNVRHFGSRRHYCFSYRPYREECRIIVTKLVERFGQHPAIIAWQTDNEYGCHSTTISFSDAAKQGFRAWCKNKYGSIDALNNAWGNVFWSMEYQNFNEIELPALTVTEANPSHRMAFWRYSSEQVVDFNQIQVEVLRKHTSVDLLHNFMGNFVEFDHFDVAKDLDIASWDNYPLGFLTRDSTDQDMQTVFMRTGDPDGSSFHHSLYRCVGRSRMWVMEQQPGPVNWAPYNPAPLPGMVRLWGLEACAHGAEVMSYFRYRQAPFAQEQMHTGLCLPNGQEDVAADEVRKLAKDLEKLQQQDFLLPADTKSGARVAMIFDYAGDQAQRIQQPGGKHFDPLVFTQRVYAACRALALDVDIVRADEDLSHYDLILLTTSTIADVNLIERLANCDTQIVLFPRTGSKTAELNIPLQLPPAHFQSLIEVEIVVSESLPPAYTGLAQGEHHSFTCVDWRERVKTSLPARAIFKDGWGFHYQQNNVHYINACLNQPSLVDLLEEICDQSRIETVRLKNGVRTTIFGNLRFIFNFGPETIPLNDTIWERLGFNPSQKLLIGNRPLPPAGVVVWKRLE